MLTCSSGFPFCPVPDFFPARNTSTTSEPPDEDCPVEERDLEDFPVAERPNEDCPLFEERIDEEDFAVEVRFEGAEQQKTKMVSNKHSDKTDFILSVLSVDFN